MKNWNKFTHKILPFILIGIIASTTVSMNYNKIRQVKAVAVVDDVALAGIITLILLSYGYVTMDYYNNTDGTSALAQDWEDAYESARFKVLEGGGGTGDNDNNDNDDDFEDTDGDGKITENDIPTWSKIIGSVGVSGALSVTIAKNADKLLSPIVSKFILNKFGENKLTSLDILNKSDSLLNDYISKNNIDLGVYPYYLKIVSAWSSKTEIEYYYIPDGYYYQSSNTSTSFKVKKTSDGDSGISFVTTINKDGTSSISKKDGTFDLKGCNFTAYYFKYWNTNLPFHNSDGVERVIWVTPDLQDTFDNKGSLNLLPPFDPSASYDIPTQQALQGLLDGLNNTDITPDGQQELLKDFLNNLKNFPSTDPDKNPDKNPDSGDSGKDNPDEKPDSGGDSGSDKDNSSFTADLKKLFPFCIPFDLVDCFRLFNAKPTTPRVEVPIHFGIVNVDYTFIIDLNDFNNVAVICRSMFLILYIVGLILITRHLIRG